MAEAVEAINHHCFDKIALEDSSGP